MESAKAAKQRIETNILALIVKFEEDHPVIVKGVDLIEVQGIGASKRTLGNVLLDVRLI